jgi:hypothetical protein
MRVAVMQPYFYPYMGYFRLIAAVDVFVLFDCVQFPRRGRVHRCEVPDGRGGTCWLTLPLSPSARDSPIESQCFPPEAERHFAGRRTGLAWLSGLPDPVAAALDGPFDRPIDYLERNLRAVAAYLQLATRFERSSALRLGPDLRKGARVRAAACAFGATHYLNAPGGRALYDPASFQTEGLELEFLGPYQGPYLHMLHALATVPRNVLAADVMQWQREAA